jgi:4'-phosphopantetheinyl transferase
VDEAGPACGELCCFSLDLPEADREPLAALLSPEELARAARFHAAEHGARFIVAHARLRQLLAPQLGVAPERIDFAVGPHGKPELAGAAAAAGVGFNLSHSGALGLVGWARQRHIGVDVECWRPMRDAAALVRRFFSPVEQADWQASPPEERTGRFFNVWTRKEAYVKAVGRGLGLSLASFDVSSGDGAEARLLRPSAHCDDGRRWSLAAPQLQQGVSLAVVLESDNLLLRPFEP